MCLVPGGIGSATQTAMLISHRRTRHQQWEHNSRAPTSSETRALPPPPSHCTSPFLPWEFSVLIKLPLYLYLTSNFISPAHPPCLLALLFFIFFFHQHNMHLYTCVGERGMGKGGETEEKIERAGKALTWDIAGNTLGFSMH